MRRARSVLSMYSIICRENRVKYQSSCSNKAAERASAPAEHRCRQRVRQAQGVGGRQYPEAVEPRAARAQHCRRATVASSLLLALSRSVLRACVRACWHACQLSVCLSVCVCLCETLTSPESSRILLAGLLSTIVTTDTSLGLFCNRLKIRYQRFYFTI